MRSPKNRDAFRLGHKPSTVNQYVAALQVCFQNTIDTNVLRDERDRAWMNPCSSVKPLKLGKQRCRVLSEEEQIRLFKAVEASRSEGFKVAFLLNLVTGARRTEI